MYFKFHFRGQEPNSLGIEFWVKTDLENYETILDWTALDENHPLMQVIARTGLGRKESVTHVVELEWEQHSALGIPQLMFSRRENEFGYDLQTTEQANAAEH